MDEKIQRIETCVFQRNAGGDWEKGLLLNEGRLGIVDAKGIHVANVHTWEQRSALVVETQYFIDG